MKDFSEINVEFEGDNFKGLIIRDNLKKKIGVILGHIGPTLIVNWEPRHSGYVPEIPEDWAKEHYSVFESDMEFQDWVIDNKIRSLNDPWME